MVSMDRVVKGNSFQTRGWFKALALILIGFVAGHTLRGSTTTTTTSSKTSGSDKSKTAAVVLRVAEASVGNGENCLPGVIYREAGFPPVPRKVEFGDFLEKQGFDRGVEVGVQRGRHAWNLLNRWKSCKYMGLVDLWAQQENYEDLANVNSTEQENRYQVTKVALKKWENKTEYFRMYSTEAAPKIPDNSVDFAYVDARHDYCGCMEDMRAYYPKVRPGGILAGHDFLYNEEVQAITPSQDWSICQDGSINTRAVRGAVEDFAKEFGLAVSITYKEKDWYSWWLQKPTLAHCVRK